MTSSKATNTSAFATAREDRYFEDYIPDTTSEFGPLLVSEEDIIDFARKFDPQAMHIDPVAAAQGPFGGLIASGWHTVSMMGRLVVTNYLSSVASLPSPGVGDVRWIRPVRSGDELRLVATTLEARRSKSKPDRGLVHTRLEAVNQNGELVASMVVMNFVLLRSP